MRFTVHTNSVFAGRHSHQLFTGNFIDVQYNCHYAFGENVDIMRFINAVKKSSETIAYFIPANIL